MLIPLIDKDPDADNFTCRDGEIEFSTCLNTDSGLPSSPADTAGYSIRLSLTPEATFPTFNIRVALRSGEAEKANLMLSGEISRVDAETADRITQAIVEKAAEEFRLSVIDFRRAGLFLLPFRVFTRTVGSNGKTGVPSPQAIMLPAEYPPHPEITAASTANDTLTLSLRIPVRPQRLAVASLDPDFSADDIETFVSYPLYVPSASEIRGSIGSVRSATGGNATGIRFSFLSVSAIKASVAAPEKYYQMIGNPRTGYRFASKATALPDYSVYAGSDYAGSDGTVSPFPEDSLIQAGSGVDPLDWIADWRKKGEGYLPVSLPGAYSGSSDGSLAWPDGIDGTYICSITENLDNNHIILTRPMALADSSVSRRKATRKGIVRMKIHGLPDSPCTAMLYGSDDGRHWQPLRVWDPHSGCYLASPRRVWHRLLLLSAQTPGAMCLEIETR